MNRFTYLDLPGPTSPLDGNELKRDPALKPSLTNLKKSLQHPNGFPSGPPPQY